MNHEEKTLTKEIFDDDSTFYKFFGLYNQQTQTPIPLQQIQVDAKIQDYIAEVTYIQHYFNQHDTKLETEYYFPITNTACFHKFSAKFGTITVDGVIKAKEEARKQYEEHKEKGGVVAYAEISEESYNIMCIKLGNIPPKTEIQIIFSYLERVEISLNKFWRFALYSTLIPSRHPKSGNKKINRALRNYPIYIAKTNESESYQHNLNVFINSKSPITFLKSTSHEVTISKAETSGIFSAAVKLESNTLIPEQDFVLLYATSSLNKPSYLMSPYEHGYCTLINFFPQTNYLTFDDAYMASLEGREVTEGFIDRAKIEYIFLIDRSDFMTPFKIALAKDALQNFLKLLPKDSYFNILSMDEPFIIVSNQSVLASEKNIGNTFAKIDEIFCKRGDLRVLEVLEYIGKAELFPNYQRNVFVLTSGRVSASMNKINHVIKNKLYKTRIFMMSLGNSSLTEFVKRATIEGYGRYEVVTNHEEISEKVSHLLKSSAAPYFTDFDLKIENEELFSYVIPLPKSLGYITPNELVEFFVIFNKKFKEAKETTFVLKFYNSMNQRYEEHKEVISIENAEPSEAVVKLGISKFCESLEKKKEIYEVMESDIGDASQKDITKKLIATSLKYGILTEYTAFICVISEGDDILRQIPIQRVSMATELSKNQVETDNEQLEESFGNPLIITEKKEEEVDEEESQARLKEKISVENEESKGIILEPDFQSKIYDDNECDNPQEVIDKGGDNDIQYEPFNRQISAGVMRDLHGFLEKSPKEKGNKEMAPGAHGEPVPRASTMKPKGSKNEILQFRSGKGMPNSPQTEKKLKEKAKPRDLHTEMKKMNSYSDNRSKNFGGLFSDSRLARFEDKKKMNTQTSISSLSELSFSLDEMTKMTKLQDSEGYWEPLVDIGRLLQKKLEDLLKQIPISLEKVEDKETIWLTILVLTWLENNFMRESKANCKKAQDWLKAKGFDYFDYSSLARKCLNW